MSTLTHLEGAGHTCGINAHDVATCALHAHRGVAYGAIAIRRSDAAVAVVLHRMEVVPQGAASACACTA